MIVTKSDSAVCSHCDCEMWQDPDTLDTWFSSALWPFSTLGWPNKTEDLKLFYPTSTLVTGYDIITFWVSRMIFSGLEYTGKIPFDTVLIHGLVRDSQGRKMSKSLGNGIDPLEIIEKYGADALRFALATGNSPGNDMRFSDERIEAARNFANKLWNAARFVLINLDIEKVELPRTDVLAIEDKWILTMLSKAVNEVTAAFEKYEIGIALSTLYDFIWDIFCDWYIELAKASLSVKGSEKNIVTQNVISYVLIETLKLLHPFMPFITEEIYSSLPHGGSDSIMVCNYPSYSNSYPAETESFDRVIAAIREIRIRRSEMNVPPSRKAKIYITTKYPESFTESTHAFFTRLASASSVELCDNYSDEGAVQIITDSATVYIPMADMVDLDKERARLTEELSKIEGEISRLQMKLSNESFTAKAPKSIVESEISKLTKYENTKSGIQEALKNL